MSASILSPLAYKITAAEIKSIGPSHRVTALTLHASESIGSHIVGAITSLLRLSLESLYTRSLASSFLAARNTERGAWILTHVYPLSLWIVPGYKGVTLSGFRDYASKIVLCIGTEVIVTSGVWRLGCGFAEWLGLSYYWGKL